MARKLERDGANKRTFMRENALKRGYCMNCKRSGVFNQLYKYWWENDIGGQDQADRHALPFCGVECYRAYNSEPKLDIPFKSVVIKRLVEEVRVDGQPSAHAYNRIYNRHNR